jgi:hypothetical protein
VGGDVTSSHVFDSKLGEGGSPSPPQEKEAASKEKEAASKEKQAASKEKEAALAHLVLGHVDGLDAVAGAGAAPHQNRPARQAGVSGAGGPAGQAGRRDLWWRC